MLMDFNSSFKCACGHPTPVFIWIWAFEEALPSTNTVDKEHAIQTDLFIYTRFHTRNMFQGMAKKQVFKHKHILV